MEVVDSLASSCSSTSTGTSTDTSISSISISTGPEVVREPPKATFLTLPVEIRLAIYEILQGQKQPRTRPPLPIHEGLPEAVLGPYCTVAELEDWINDKRDNETVISVIRAVNRQLRRETAEFMTYPKLSLSIACDMKTEKKMPEGVEGTMEDGFAVDYSVAAILYYRCMEGFWRCRHKTKGDAMFGDKRPRFPRLVHAFDAIMRRLAPPRPLHAPSFNETIAKMEVYKKFTWLEINLNHGDLLEWFKDPVQGVACLVPFIKREGMMVTLKVRHRKNIKGNTTSVYHKMAEVLEKGGGEVVMRRVGGDDERVELVLRTSEDATSREKVNA